MLKSVGNICINPNIKPDNIINKYLLLITFLIDNLNIPYSTIGARIAVEISIIIGADDVKLTIAF